jgi:hypothetical protein
MNVVIVRLHNASVMNDMQSFPSKVLKSNLTPIQFNSTKATLVSCAYNGTSTCPNFMYPWLKACSHVSMCVAFKKGCNHEKWQFIHKLYMLENFQVGWTTYTWHIEHYWGSKFFLTCCLALCVSMKLCHMDFSTLNK